MTERKKGKTGNQRTLIPDRVPFAVWKRRVLRTIEPASQAGGAFKPWMKHLGMVYQQTMPLLSSESEKKQQENLLQRIKETGLHLKAIIQALDGAKCAVIPKSGTAPFMLDRLQQRLAEAEFEVRRVLSIVTKSKEQEAKVYSHCILFLLELLDSGVSLKNAASICTVLMRAHGFSPSQLKVFGARSLKNKTLQKGIRKYQAWIVSPRAPREKIVPT